MSLWKLIGLAGIAGVAASGAVIARDQRQRNAYSADEVRHRIHERAEEALAAQAGPGADGVRARAAEVDTDISGGDVSGDDADGVDDEDAQPDGAGSA